MCGVFGYRATPASQAPPRASAQISFAIRAGLFTAIGAHPHLKRLLARRPPDQIVERNSDGTYEFIFAQAIPVPESHLRDLAGFAGFMVDSEHLRHIAGIAGFMVDSEHLTRYCRECTHQWTRF